MRTLLLAVSLLIFAACHKSTTAALTPVTTSGDTTFTGSYINLNYAGNSVSIKGLKIGQSQYSTVVGSNAYLGYHQIAGSDPWSIYGMKIASLNVVWNGTDTGSFPIYKTAVTSFQVNGHFYSDTAGTVRITQIDSAHFEGTFNITLYGAGPLIPATGDFKIYY